MERKKCFKCGETKPLDCFYAHPQMRDGHLNKCKECAREDRRRHEENAADSVLRTRLKVCGKNPTQKNAYRAVEMALKCGVLARPEVCHGCGCNDDEHRIEAHHHDYSKPLDVIWLCTPCHRRMDSQRRAHEALVAATEGEHR